MGLHRSRHLTVPLTLGLLLMGSAASAKPAAISKQSQECIDCHSEATPGIVYDWRRSRHARTSPAQALKRPALARRMSASRVPKVLSRVAVGCFECHGLRTAKHKDRFKHNGQRINVVVTPADCATCHADEARQYGGSKKAHAVGNLRNNPLFMTLVNTLTGTKSVKGPHLRTSPPHAAVQGQSCFACHGTRVKVAGTRKVSTDYGDYTLPRLTGWPNQGVGRENPDGSRGSCTACHPRHGFAIEVARKPHTCSQCHLEPDVPAWNVYRESKHGNIYSSQRRGFDWQQVPWRPGKDFRVPTCASCHSALLATSDGTVVAKRTHDFGSRLWLRLFGLIYATPQPRDGRTWRMRNADGQPLPVTFRGKQARRFLIAPREQQRRQQAMSGICRSCHSSGWTANHFASLTRVSQEANKMTRAATELLQRGWQRKLAAPQNPFDEGLEQLWLKQWLFYANSVRYAAAMSGPDYASFKNGWFQLTTNLQKLHEALRGSK